jgi:hypothetical protein
MPPIKGFLSVAPRRPRLPDLRDDVARWLHMYRVERVPPSAFEDHAGCQRTACRRIGEDPGRALLHDLAHDTAAIGRVKGNCPSAWQLYERMLKDRSPLACRTLYCTCHPSNLQHLPLNLGLYRQCLSIIPYREDRWALIL